MMASYPLPDLLEGYVYATGDKNQPIFDENSSNVLVYSEKDNTYLWLKCVEKETAALVYDEGNDSVQRESNNPVQRESNDPLQRESNDPLQRESNDPLQRESNDPLQRESNDPIHRESNDPVQRESNNSWNKVEFNDNAVKLLLDLFYERRDKFRDSTIKKKVLWTEITDLMNAVGYKYTHIDVDRKFRNLKSHFLSIKDNNTKTGRGRISWPYFGIMEKIFENDCCVTPTALVASMEIPAVSKQSTMLCKNTPHSFAGNLQSPVLPLAGSSLIKELYPETEMVPENSTNEEVIDAVKKRRLTNNPHIKKVNRRSANVALSTEKELTELQVILKDHNAIQKERNDLLKKILEKL